MSGTLGERQRCLTADIGIQPYRGAVLARQSPSPRRLSDNLTRPVIGRGLLLTTLG